MNDMTQIDRDTATKRMSMALDEFYIEGIQHNIPFLSALMEHPRWISGELTTGFIAEEYPDGFSGVELESEGRNVLSVVAASIDHLMNARKRAISEQMGGVPVRFSEERNVRLGDEYWQPVRIEGDDDERFEVSLLNGEGDSRSVLVRASWRPGIPVWRGLIDDVPVAVQVEPVMNGVLLSWRGAKQKACVFTNREAELAQLMPIKLPPDMSKFLLCPMPGLIVSLAVAEGEDVKAGQTLCVVEAMKMENVLKAERDGTVSAIKAAPGDILGVDEVIMEFA